MERVRGTAEEGERRVGPADGRWNAGDGSIGGPGAAVQPFGGIRALHHRLAREVASGAALAFVAVACGVPLARVESLARSPAFKELVAYYRR